MNVALLLIFATTLLTPAIAGDVSKTYQLYHSFDSSADSFSPRGSITLSADSTSSSNGIEASVINLEDSLEADIVNRIVEEGGGFYRIKVVEEESGRSALASVPACEIRRANFREEIELTIGHTGSLLSLSYTPLVSPLASQCTSLPPLTSTPKFTTQITYFTSTIGMTIPTLLPKTKPPPGLKWIPRASVSGTAAPGGTQSDQSGGGGDKTNTPPFGDEDAQKARDNQSFLRKYWYIILPLALSTFFSAEEPAGGKQGAEAGRGVAATAGAVAAAAGGGGRESAVRQRRGKRG